MPPPIDPHAGPDRAIHGRVVTMNAQRRVIDDAVVYIRDGSISEVRKAAETAPEGFETVPIVKSGGTIFPGLIELHNHLPYNILPLWQVPKRYENRDQWGSASNPQYRELISGPMKILGPREEYISAIVRYVECKALIGGTTTTQGVALFSNSGARRYYRGIVRNVEQTDDPELPETDAHIADIEAKHAEVFYKRLQKKKKVLLHLSEGADDAARRHFTALHLSDGRWALSQSLIAIHCVALRGSDLGHLHARGTTMVWSPLSNLLLYGKTAAIADARKRNILIGIGADWSPSGSKNVLGEMRVAAAVAELEDLPLQRDDIVAMATCDGARMLGWDEALGSLETGKLADLVVIADDAKGDPYKNLLSGDETKISLVMIGGTGRYGTKTLVSKFGTVSESLKVGGKSRTLNLSQVTEDPVVAELSLEDARQTLTTALASLPELARRPVALTAAAGRGGPRWMLALDELADTGADLRPRLPDATGTPTGPGLEPELALAAPALADIVKPLKLDPISRADDHDYDEQLSRQTNLPSGLVGLLA